MGEPTKTLRFAKCADCDAIYHQRALPTECVECGAMAPVFEPWDPAADDRAINVGEVLYALASWLEELDQHRDVQGMLYGSYADALSLIATALPDHDHLWMDEDETAEERLGAMAEEEGM